MKHAIRKEHLQFYWYLIGASWKPPNCEGLEPPHPPQLIFSGARQQWCCSVPSWHELQCSGSGYGSQGFGGSHLLQQHLGCTVNPTLTFQRQAAIVSSFHTTMDKSTSVGCSCANWSAHWQFKCPYWGTPPELSPNLKFNKPQQITKKKHCFQKVDVCTSPQHVERRESEGAPSNV